MRTPFVALSLVLAAAACGAIGSNPDAPHPKFDPAFEDAYGARIARAPTRTGVHLAVWTVDADANLAYPTCPACASVVGMADTACENCGTKVSVAPTTIRCPECAGAKSCAQCAPDNCAACDGSHLCGICDGTGRWAGDTCPACDGSKSCEACASGAASLPCDHCEGTHVCGSCGGAGTIELE